MAQDLKPQFTCIWTFFISVVVNELMNFVLNKPKILENIKKIRKQYSLRASENFERLFQNANKTYSTL